MDTQLATKVAMISGATKGIGLAIAKSLAGQGMKLSICARNKTELEQASLDLMDNYAIECITTAGDLSQPEVVQSWVEHTQQHFGQIDVLVNNAGAAMPGRFEDLPDTAWHNTFAIKPFGYIRASRAVLPWLKKKSGLHREYYWFIGASTLTQISHRRRGRCGVDELYQEFG